MFVTELGQLAREVGALDRSGVGAPIQLAVAFFTAADLPLVRAHGVVRVEALGLSLLRRVLEHQRFLPLDLDLGFAPRQIGHKRLFTLGRIAAQLLLRSSANGQLEQLLGGLAKGEVLDFGFVADVALGLGGLPLERGEVALDLGDDVTDAQQVLARLVHLRFGLLAAGFVLGDAGGFFDDHAPVFGARRNDETNFALLNDRVGLGSDASAQEQVGYVFEADGRLVDGVFAGAVAIQSARNGDLCVVAELERQALSCLGVGVVEGEGDLGHPVGATAGGPGKNDVRHGTSAQVLGTLLADAPANGVHDVGLATSVGPNDANHVVVEVNDRAVHERLEA